MSKDDAISIMNNSNLKGKSGLLYIYFLLLTKMTETTCYQRNRETILNRAKICYNKNKGKKIKKKD